MFDRGFSPAPLADLHDRGSLESTLVAAIGEFGQIPEGRPQITKERRGRQGVVGTTGPHCYNRPPRRRRATFAGAGSSGPATPTPPYPVLRDPVTPPDVAATIYQALGLDPETLIRDHLDRPFPLSTGTPIRALVG